MTEEEKQAALEAEAKAKADAKAAEDAEFEASLEGLSDEEKAEKKAEKDAQYNDNKIDYEAELAKEREAREKAEKALAEDRYKHSEAQRKKDEEGDKDDEKPLTKKELAELLERERNENRKIIQSTQVESIASRLATSDSERNLLIEIHRNRSFPSHLSIQEQLEECYAIANRKKLVGERNEALRALKGKEGSNKDSSGTYQDNQLSNEPKIAPQDAEAFKAVGFIWNGKTRQYEKKLPNGDLLIRDSKTKQTRLIKKPS